jgi:integrase
VKLTATYIKALKTKDKIYKESDGKGLFLLIHPNGSKYWRLNYRFEGKQKTLALGVYPETSLADAREKALKARIDMAKGIDPSQVRKAKKVKSSGVNHFQSVAKRWHDEMIADQEWSRNHADKIWRSLTAHVFPHIGSDEMETLGAPEIKPVLDKLADAGKTEMQKKIKQRISGIFNHSISEGVVKGNPTTAIKTRKHHAKNYNHITFDELPELIKAIQTENLEATTRCGLMIALLTFQRTNEIRFATWDEIDFDKALWTIPAERMKMKREHLVPLSDQALAQFKELQTVTGAYNYIFASYHKPEKQPFSENAMLFALYRLGYRGRMTVHGFRHLASTQLNERGYDSRHIEKQLSHEDKNTIRGTYNKAEYLTERTKMMQDWAGLVLNIDTL